MSSQQFEIRTAKTVLYRPDTNTIKGFLNSDKIIPFCIHSYLILTMIVAVFGIFFDGYYTSIFLNTSIFLTFALIFAIFLDEKKKDDKEVIVKNQKGNKFMFCLGK